jgi:hypothetical protein
LCTTSTATHYYELWNETNTRNFWSGTTAGMVKMAKLAYPIIHSDPHSMVLTPSVARPVGNIARDSGSVWMAAYLHAGGAAYADGGAFHGYIKKANQSLRKRVPAFTDRMDAASIDIQRMQTTLTELNGATSSSVRTMLRS